MSRSQDILGIIRGIQLVANASVKTQEAYLKHLWSHSSVRDAIEKSATPTIECGNKMIKNPAEELQKVGNLLKETLERSSVVVEGIKQFSASKRASSAYFDDIEISQGTKSYSSIKHIPNLDIASITLKELENLLSEHSKLRDVSLRIDSANTSKAKPQEKLVVKAEPLVFQPETQKPVRKPPQPDEEQMKNITNDEKKVESVMKFITNFEREPETSSNEKSKSFVPEVRKTFNLLLLRSAFIHMKSFKVKSEINF